MKRLFLFTNAEPTLKTKMYLVKSAVYRLLGHLLKTRDLKRLAIASGWVIKGYADFRRKQTWLNVYDALVRERRRAAISVAA